MKSDAVSVYAVGDVRPDRPHPETLFELAAPALRQADIRFGQLEANLSDKGEAQLQGYPITRIPSDRVSGLTYAGFDVMSFAANQTMDLGEVGLFETMKTLAANNIAVVGVGRDIEEARRPVVIERNGNRIAFLAYCSVLPRGYEARENKPGCAPMRASTHYEQVDWQPGTALKILTFAHKGDLAALVDDVQRAKAIADVVIMSIHWGIHHVPGEIAMYQKEVGHAAIDAGVDLILGHHAHVLKAIELYKGKAIFYSLGNFVQPSKQRKGPFRSLHEVRSDPDYPDYDYAVDERKSMIAKCLVHNKKIARLSYLPVMINGRAQPEVLSRADSRSQDVFEYVRWSCADQNIDTRFCWNGDEVVIEM